MSDAKRNTALDSNPVDSFQGKPELDAERNWHEMPEEKEHRDLDGQSSRQEMPAEQIGDGNWAISTPQELRGVEPSSELDVDHSKTG